jgi:hypothetical protein
MTIAGYKRSVIGLLIALAIMSGIAAWCGYHGLRNGMETMLTDNWAMVLDEMRQSGLEHTNATEIATTLRDVGRWYHGPAPDKGTPRHLHNLMERVRAGVERDLIRHLREVTGEDLGMDPNPWIRKYAKPEK